jgi:hypothetical protein
MGKIDKRLVFAYHEAEDSAFVDGGDFRNTGPSWRSEFV